MERNVSIITNLVNPWLLAFILLIVALLIVSYLQWKKYHKTDILFGWAWFAIMMLPVSGIIAINGLMYEHWLYIPLVGFFIMVYGILELINQKLVQHKIAKYCFISIICIFGLLTLIQNYIWSSPITLYTHLLKHTDSARIHNNLAMAYSEHGQRQEALTHYKIAIDYGMAYPQIYHNMGNTYRDLGDTANAEVAYRKALEINPAFFHTYGNLIGLYLKKEQYTEALAVVNQAQQYYPELIDYHLLELQILHTAGDTKSFEEKKTFVQQNFANDPKLGSFLKALQFAQE